MSAAVRTCVRGVRAVDPLEAEMMTLSPATAEALKLMRLVKVVELAISEVLTNESLLASVVMATARPTAALVRVGAVVSRVALSVPCAVELPAASLTMAVTVSAAPSAGLEKVVVA